MQEPVISAGMDRVAKSEVESVVSSKPPRPRRASMLERSQEDLKMEQERDRTLFNRTWPLMKGLGWTLAWGGPFTSLILDRDMYVVPGGRYPDGQEVLRYYFPNLDHLFNILS